MKVNDLSGMVFGTLRVLKFDEDRHDKDLILKVNGEINKVRRYYICECLLCGNIVSVRGENLVSGNTKGCGCDAAKKTGVARHNSHLNTYSYNDDKGCWVGLSNNTNSKFLFDDIDYKLISDRCWYETKYGYMATRISPKRQILLHRLILVGEGADDRVVDHINRDRLDCRRCNLRLCTAKENSYNTGVHSNSISGERGVRWHQKSSKWNAYITVGGTFKSLGYYDDIESAKSARRSAEIQLMGEYAPLL